MWHEGLDTLEPRYVRVCLYLRRGWEGWGDKRRERDRHRLWDNREVGKSARRMHRRCCCRIRDALASIERVGDASSGFTLVTKRDAIAKYLPCESSTFEVKRHGSSAAAISSRTRLHSVFDSSNEKLGSSRGYAVN